MNTQDNFHLYCEDQGYRNNRCAGYALAAILSDIGNQKESGLKTYEELLKRQAFLLQQLDTESASDAFLNNPIHICDGTRMILPSSIIHLCLALHLSPALLCSDKRETIFQTDVFNEDCEQMPDCVYRMDDYESFVLSANHYTHLLALTRFRHWVALKSTPNGFYLFDPAPSEFGGGLFGPAPFKELLPLEKSISAETLPINYFDELLIGLKR